MNQRRHAYEGRERRIWADRASQWGLTP